MLGVAARAGRALAHGRPLKALGYPFVDHRIDELYLLLPGLFDQPSPPHRPLRRDHMLGLFRELAAAPTLDLDAVVGRLRAAIASSDRTLLLLTSNFSETGRMPLSAETTGYVKMVRQSEPTHNTLVVIKPHPRDSERKLQAVTASLEQQCRVVSLTGPPTAYLPFEVILSRLVDDERVTRSTLTGLCVSTACLALEYLYGVRCEVGFGDRDAAGFGRPWRRQRAQHEHDLRQALDRIRNGDFGDHPTQEQGNSP